MVVKDKLYSYQMMQDAGQEHEKQGTAHFGGESHHLDQSPFNSKFTVLKFNSHGKSPIQAQPRGAPSKYGGSGGQKATQARYTDLTPVKRNLFGNATNNPETHPTFAQARNQSKADMFASPAPVSSRIGTLLCSPLLATQQPYACENSLPSGMMAP